MRRNRKNDRKEESKPEDLDRQLKNYWINQKDSSKSKEGMIYKLLIELKQIASKKFND
jgi:hypothetical protein